MPMSRDVQIIPYFEIKHVEAYQTLDHSGGRGQPAA